MAEMHDRRGLGRPAILAIGFAVVALLTSLVAVVVVLRRGGGHAPPIPPVATAPGPVELTVAASDIIKLKRDVIEMATDDKGTVVGMKLRDERLQATLGLAAGDVITAIGGRALRREFDVYDAILGMSMMDASTVYVDVMRAKQPVLVRWKVEGDLRTARRDPATRSRTPLGTSLGSTPFGTPTARDPLVATIKKIDDLHYEVPRSTVDRLLANPDMIARQARIVPSIRSGQPDGFKLYAIRPGSLWSAVGITNGDTLRSVNGLALTSPDKALEVYTKIRDATEISIGFLRRGGPEETLTITIN